MTRFAPILTFACLLLSAGATAADGPPRTVTWPDCYCTDTNGGRVELGQRVCLMVGGREFVAFCDMSLNVPIWRDTGEECLTG